MVTTVSILISRWLHLFNPANSGNCDLYFRRRSMEGFQTPTSGCLSSNHLYLGLSISVYRDNCGHKNARDPALYYAGWGEFIYAIGLAVIVFTLLQ
jgi:hypothetical protein